MRYKDSLDNSIIKELLKNDSQFNELLRRLQVSTPALTQVTLNRHITKLCSQGIIHRKEPPKIGKRGAIRISPIAREEIKLGIFRLPVSTRRSKQNISDEERMRNAIHLILSVASSGSSTLKEISKPRPGDIAIPISDDLSNGFRSYSVEHKEGFSATDFLNKMWMGGNAGTFRNSGILPDQIHKMLSVLEEKSIVRLISIGKDTRYGIADNNLSDFIGDCVILFSSVLSRMLKTWIYRKPKSNEVDWMRIFFGTNELLRIFRDAESTRKMINSKNKKLKLAEKKELERQIKLFDGMIKGQIVKIDTRKHKILQFSVFSKIFTEISYPEFIQKLQKNHAI